jgi:hypothetical protein
LKTYIAPEYLALLQSNQLDSFERLWHHQVDWFEPPNHRRGGWSGVAKVQLKEHGQPLGVFIKKQQNHTRWSLESFPRREPTFRREFRFLRMLQTKKFNAPEVLFYGEQLIDGQPSAILITKELHTYQPLDAVVNPEAYKDMIKPIKSQLLQAVAQALRSAHKLNLMHRALYPKHIFVADVTAAPKVALIDFEKTRYSPFFWYNAFFDLAALNRHSSEWSQTERLRFFKNYCQISRLTWLSKWFCRRIIARSKRGRTSVKAWEIPQENVNTV